jgi:hypothetical protein
MSSQFLLSLLVVGLFGTGPESTIKVVEEPSQSSPVAITGTVIAPDRQAGVTAGECKAKLTVRNTSTKPIVVFVFHLEVKGTGYTDWNLTMQQDNFYSEHQLGPGSVMPMEITRRPTPQRVDSDAEEQSPQAVVSVQFVEFLDGTTWGDSAVGLQVKNERRIHLQNLKDLWQVYQTGGDTEFEIALLKPSSDDAVEILQAMYRERNNLRVVTDRLSKLLAFAEAHEKGTSPPSQ